MNEPREGGYRREGRAGGPPAERKPASTRGSRPPAFLAVALLVGAFALVWAGWLCGRSGTRGRADAACDEAGTDTAALELRLARLEREVAGLRGTRIWAAARPPAEVEARPDQPAAASPARNPSPEEALRALEDGFTRQPPAPAGDQEAGALRAALAGVVADRAVVAECACGARYCRVVLVAANPGDQLAVASLVSDSSLGRTVAYAYDSAPSAARTTLYVSRPGESLPTAPDQPL
jgi:hypothetical protein